MRGACLAALVILLAAPLAGCIRDFDEREHDNHVNLRSIDVSAPAVTTGTVTLTVNTTLDNRDAPSDPLHLVVRVFDQNTGFLVETKRTANQTLDEDTTTSHDVTFTVPRKSGYRIQVDVYEAGRVVENGRITVHNVGALEPTSYETSLSIDAIEVSVTNVSRQRVRLSAQIYTTNQGSTASSSVELQVKALSIDTRLLADEAWGKIPTVEPERTHIETVELVVPDEHNYEVHAVLWDDNVSVERGRDTVQLLPEKTIPEDQEIVKEDPNIEDFIRREGGRDAADGERGTSDTSEAAETPGPGAIAALLAIATVAVYARRRNP